MLPPHLFRAPEAITPEMVASALLVMALASDRVSEFARCLIV